MSGYNFSDGTRAALARACDEAVALDHEYIGTEHILLGVLDDDGTGNLLQSLDVDAGAIRALVLRTVPRGRASRAVGPDLPYSTRAKQALELARAEANQLRHPFVDSVHVLLGLLREKKGIAAQVLVHSGVTLDRARVAMLRSLRNPG